MKDSFKKRGIIGSNRFVENNFLICLMMKKTIYSVAHKKEIKMSRE